MNRISTELRGQIVACLVEGMSMRATCRVTGAARNTVAKLLVDVGEACSEWQDMELSNLDIKRLQCDEIWSFIGAEQARVTGEHPEGYGDIWTWTAIDADSRLVPSWLVGERNAQDGYAFLCDLHSRLRPGQVQITMGGHQPYLPVIEYLFGADRVDFAMLDKMYGLLAGPEHACSTPRRTGVDARIIAGNPNPKRISTSYVERQNLTMRIGMRRYPHPTNAFSKKVENHAAAVSLHFMHYNFGRPHATLSRKFRRPTTPAMAAGVAGHPWSPLQIAGLLE